MSNLDRALCERLGIPPRVEAGQTEHLGSGYSIVRKAPQYPALSTTGDGMVLLMEALQRHGWDWDARNGREPARVTFGVFCIELFAQFPQERRQYYATSASAPMALALAAAAALGIEVPE